MSSEVRPRQYESDSTEMYRKQGNATIVLKIRKPNANLLFEGSKHVEILRVVPKRAVGSAFVYETEPTSKMRGTLVLSAAEKVVAEELTRRLKRAEINHAAGYLDRITGALCLLKLKRCVEFEDLYSSPLVEQRLGPLRSFTYLDPAEPLYAELLWQHLAGTAPREPRVFSVRVGSLSDEPNVDAAIVNEVGRYYEELEFGFEKTHLPAIGCAVDSTGFSSLQKTALSITDDDGPVGKIVLTLKRGLVIKVAPIYVRPSHRGRGMATRAIVRLVTRASELGIRQVFTTVPTTNKAARGVFDRAGFLPNGSLSRHYRQGVDEDILIAWPAGQGTVGHTASGKWPSSARSFIVAWVNQHFFPTDDAWLRWLSQRSQSLGHFEGKPHETVEIDGAAALVIYKRGGTAKIIPAVRDGVIPSSLITACEESALAQGRRKTTVLVPHCLPVQPALEKYSYEATLSTYSLYENVSLYSRIIAP